MEQFQFLSNQEQQNYPQLVQDAVFLIEEEYAYLCGVDELADRLEVSKHHLIRLFSASAGISPGKYLSQIRIFHAMLMLRSGADTPMEIVAGACGYSCANYFCKAFKKQTGLTPSEYANAVRKNSESADTGPLPEEFYL